MTKQVQRRRGTNTQHTGFTGADGEISVNTTNKSIHVHDGATAGGFEAARADLLNVDDADVATAISGGTVPSLTITSADINGGTIDGTTIGASSAAAGTFTNLTSTGTSTHATVDINGGNIDGTIIGASSAAAITGTTITGTSATVTGDLTVDTNTLYVDSTNNRVGVGTASPATALDVTGTVTADGLTVDGNAASTLEQIALSNNNTSFAAGVKISASFDSDNEEYGNITWTPRNAAQGYFQINNLLGSSLVKALEIDGNDISFYEDTGTTAKFFWDASAESLGIGTSNLSSKLTIEANNAGQSPTTSTNAIRFVDTDPSLVSDQPTGSLLWETSDTSDSGIHAYISTASLNTGAASLVFGTGTATSLAERLRIDSSGTVTKPYQPSFMVSKTSDQTLTIGVTTVTWEAEQWDVGGNFASNIFTAPVTGKYYLHVQMRVDNFDTAAGNYLLLISTSNRSKQVLIDPNFSADLLYYTMSLGSVFDMDAGDTANVKIQQTSGTASHIDDNAVYTSWSGYLLG